MEGLGRGRGIALTKPAWMTAGIGKTGPDTPVGAPPSVSRPFLCLLRFPPDITDFTHHTSNETDDRS